MKGFQILTLILLTAVCGLQHAAAMEDPAWTDGTYETKRWRAFYESIIRRARQGAPGFTSGDIELAQKALLQTPLPDEPPVPGRPLPAKPTAKTLSRIPEGKRLGDQLGNSWSKARDATSRLVELQGKPETLDVISRRLKATNDLVSAVDQFNLAKEKAKSAGVKDIGYVLEPSVGSNGDATWKNVFNDALNSDGLSRKRLESQVKTARRVLGARGPNQVYRPLAQILRETQHPLERRVISRLHATLTKSKIPAIVLGLGASAWAIHRRITQSDDPRSNNLPISTFAKSNLYAPNGGTSRESFETSGGI
jgi:hypothetical protein